MKDVGKKVLRDLKNKLAGKRVLVVGDVMMDEYIWGRVDRISPEAPIPVVAVSGETHRPGGAANVAWNIRMLGGEADLVGVVGSDAQGKQLAAELKAKGIDDSGLVYDSDRPTIQKTRVMAQNQQVVRIDRERQHPISEKIQKEVLERCRAAMQKADAVVLSDYAKGLLSADLVRALVADAKLAGKPITADPKPSNIELFKGVTLISPNAGEALAATGRQADIHSDEAFEEVGKALREQLKAESVLITRSEAGMTLVEKFGSAHIHSHAQKVFDVTGAGDTVISTLTLALAAGGSAKESAALANLAASVVVAEVGVAAVTPEQLDQVIDEHAEDL